MLRNREDLRAPALEVRVVQRADTALAERAAVPIRPSRLPPATEAAAALPATVVVQPSPLITSWLY